MMIMWAAEQKSPPMEEATIRPEWGEVPLARGILSPIPYVWKGSQIREGGEVLPESHGAWRALLAPPEEMAW
jgi:hypothetical protein